MEKLLKQIVQEIGSFRGEFNDFQTRVDNRLDTLEGNVSELNIVASGMRDEHGRMLRAIIESKEVQRGEIDNLQHQSALLEGTLKRAANQIMEDLKEAK